MCIRDRSNWSGKTFSTNVWGHDAAVYKSISDTINKGLTGGWSIDRMARALSERTGVAYHRADTLVKMCIRDRHGVY